MLSESKCSRLIGVSKSVACVVLDNELGHFYPMDSIGLPSPIPLASAKRYYLLALITEPVEKAFALRGQAHSVFVGVVDSGIDVEILSGGQAFDRTRIRAQLRIYYLT